MLVQFLVSLLLLLPLFPPLPMSQLYAIVLLVLEPCHPTKQFVSVYLSSSYASIFHRSHLFFGHVVQDKKCTPSHSSGTRH